jgi:hypothetical protein
MNALLNYRFFSPARAVLDDLIDSGNLAIVRSDTVRFALQRYMQQLEQLRVVEQRERDFIADVIEPYVAEAVRLDDLLPVQSYDDPIRAPPSSLVGFRARRSDDTLANLAFMRLERSVTAYRFGRLISRRIDGLVELLDEEIDGR